MAKQIEVRVPDIGDFKDVAVIEVLVKPGETIVVEGANLLRDGASIAVRPQQKPDAKSASKPSAS